MTMPESEQFAPIIQACKHLADAIRNNVPYAQRLTLLETVNDLAKELGDEWPNRHTTPIEKAWYEVGLENFALEGRDFSIVLPNFYLAVGMMAQCNQNYALSMQCQRESYLLLKDVATITRALQQLFSNIQIATVITEKNLSGIAYPAIVQFTEFLCRRFGAVEAMRLMINAEQTRRMHTDYYRYCLIAMLELGLLQAGTELDQILEMFAEEADRRERGLKFSHWLISLVGEQITIDKVLAWISQRDTSPLSYDHDALHLDILRWMQNPSKIRITYGTAENPISDAFKVDQP